MTTTTFTPPKKKPPDSKPRKSKNPRRRRKKTDPPLTRRPRKGSKAEAILTLAATTPALNIQIAKAVGCDRSTVTQTLQTYGVLPNTLESFKKYRADVFAAAQEKDLEIYHSLQPDERKKMILKRGMVDFGILYDKERIERGISNPDQPILVIIKGGEGNTQINVGQGQSGGRAAVGGDNEGDAVNIIPPKTPSTP